ncbi:MAG: hypothetical protein OXG03_05015 [Gammaproteobacteria bacterium]|nr:hypothetical protein [Gammaproteobacteria bacterium]
MIERTIVKILSPNDVGETGGHQAGLLIPKKESILSFFPPLETSIQNPRVHLLFEDQSGYHWKFAFIYYNNKFFGGTRNEYRLTGMTRYIREAGLVSGDEVLMHRHANGSFAISYRRAQEPATIRNEAHETVLVLSSNWKVINI